MRLRRVRSRTEGWTRRRSGRGWTYLDADGQPITGAERERLEALAIPPAWSEVWICPFENGHLQATGIDDAGRTQYRYHPDWTRRRNLAKFDRVLEVAAVLPDLRRQVAADLARTDRSRDHAAALAVRLLDTGAFRVGNDAYARQGSFGLTTLERRHVRAEGAGVVVKFVGKSGVEHRVLVDDPEAVAALNRMRRRRPGGPRLLEYRGAHGPQPLDSGDVNDYLREVTGLEVSAKDLRTWAGTLLAAASLATTEESGASQASRDRAVRSAMKEVAEGLGNTPAVARSSYVDPRVVSRYESGETIAAAALRGSDPVRVRAAVEKATIDLLS